MVCIINSLIGICRKKAAKASWKISKDIIPKDIIPNTSEMHPIWFIQAIGCDVSLMDDWSPLQ